MVKLSSFNPLALLFPPLSGEITENLSCAKLGRRPGDISESTDVCRGRGLGEGGENTSPGMVEMDKYSSLITSFELVAKARSFSFPQSRLRAMVQRKMYERAGVLLYWEPGTFVVHAVIVY